MKALQELGKGDLIDNFPGKEGENEGVVCFLIPYPSGKIGAFVKQETTLQLL